VTLFQSTSSSSARSIGIAVITPWPISSIESMMRALPSAVIFTHTLGSNTPAALASRLRPGAKPPIISPPPATALVLRKRRRVTVIVCFVMAAFRYARAAR
jgi:hypothetical protein